MKIYITKYALTQGIIELDRTDMVGLNTDEGRLLFCDGNGVWNTYTIGEWYTDRQLALGDAEVRRQRKVASLKKQLTKYENMKFH